MKPSPLKALLALSCIAVTAAVWASQSYVPPPPPKLPELLSGENIRLGRRLFEENVFEQGRIEIHNFLGKVSCASCHDAEAPLSGESLAKGFGTLRETINWEIQSRCQGDPLPLRDPAMEALVHYIVDRYRLQDFKLSK